MIEDAGLPIGIVDTGGGKWKIERYGRSET